MAQLHGNFFSYSLGFPIDFELLLPSRTVPDLADPAKRTHNLPARFPILYLLHGHGNDYEGWPRYTSMERYCEERRIAAVTVSCGNKAWMDADYGENYYALLEKELPEFLTQYFPISDRPEDSYIAGLSMGGYGAMAHGFGHPASYRAVGAFSPGVYMDRLGPEALGHNQPEMMDIRSLVKDCCASGKQMPDLFLCVGQEDFLHEDVTDFHQYLSEMGVAHRYDDVPGFAHEWRFWDLELQAFLDWIPRTDAYKDERTNV